MSLSLFVKKLIAGIIAFLMPITTIATVQPKNVAPATQDYHAEVIYTEYGNDENVPDEEDFDVQTPDEDKTEGQDEQQAPKQEANEPVEEEPEIEEGEEAQGIAPVAEWDISDTDEDNVHMYYYDTEDVSLIDNITAAVRALFVPMTAYAEPLKYDEDTEEEDNTVYRKGTVIITGEGATEEYIFLNWLDYDEFTTRYEAWCEEVGYEDEAYVLRSYIDENGKIYYDAVSADYARGLYSELGGDVNKAMFEDYTPTHLPEFINAYEDFWTTCVSFIPKYVYIRGDVTEINFCAFAFCTELEEVYIEANVEKIDTAAFAQTNIKKITLPATVKNIGNSAFLGSENLKEVYVTGRIDSCAEYAFDDLAENSNIICNDYVSYGKIAGVNYEIMPLAVDDIVTELNDNTKVVYRVDDPWLL